MNVLIVHAHPEPLSFNSSMKTTAVQHFEAQGHTVQVSDLYAMAFNPVASKDDFLSPSNPDYTVYALEQRHGYEQNTLKADIASELDKVKWADLIVFNFPLFWGSVPAILKGWFDRVLVSGYTYGGRRVYDQGGLVGKQALVTLSLGGRDYMFAEDGIHGSLNSMLKPVLQGTLGYIGLTVYPPFAAYHVPYLSDDQRADIMNQFKQFLTNYTQLTPLEFPQLAQFDKAFKRI